MTGPAGAVCADDAASATVVRDDVPLQMPGKPTPPATPRTGSSRAARRAGSTPATQPDADGERLGERDEDERRVHRQRRHDAAAAPARGRCRPPARARRPRPPAPPLRRGTGAAPSRAVRRARPAGRSRGCARPTAIVMIVTMPTAPTSSEMLPSAPPPRQDVEDVRQRAQHVLLRDDREVLAAVARDEDRLGRFDDALARSRLRRRVKLISMQRVAVEQLERARRRDVGHVVEVDAEELAPRLHHADDAERQAADAHARAERALGAEQLALQLRAEHDEAARALGVVGRQELAARHAQLERLDQRAVAP